MTTKHKIKALSVDDLLKQQEWPICKKRRLSESNEDSGNEGSESSSEEESASDSEGDDKESLPENLGDDDGDGDEEETDASNSHEASELNIEGRLGLFGRTKVRIPAAVAPPADAPNSRPSFSSLGISTQLQKALNSMSIKEPTEVQSACIPPLLSGEYVCLPLLDSQLMVF